MRKIIIDCDPGHDDAIAIMLAAAHLDKLEILGITTIGGNQHIDHVTTNALKICELIKLDVPVAKGSAMPLLKPLRTAPEAHGDSGMDGPILPKPVKQIAPEGAVVWLYKTLLESEEKITLVPIGPLTNIALLIKTYPEIISKIELISLMGGGLAHGNVTAAAEFNIYVDPDAAKIVFESGVPIVMSGLDVTSEAYLDYEDADFLKGTGKISQTVSELLDFYNQYGKMFGYKGSAMHDACAIAYLIDETLFKGENYHVSVDTTDGLCRGMTLADRRYEAAALDNKNAFILLEVDRKRFRTLLLEAFALLDQRSL